MDLSDRIVLISGAGREGGQGAAEAELLLSYGATVIIGDINDDEGEALAARLGERCRFVHLDVCEPDDWQGAMAQAERLGGLNALVNNAGVYVPGHLADTTPDQFMLHMRVNQLGPFLGMQHAVPLLERSCKGSIVNVSSSSGLKGSARSIAYCGTKWALRGMTKAAALDLGAKGIRVNSIHPGPVETRMIMGWDEATRAARAASVPLGRNGKATEIADLVAFLVSDQSSFITGAEIAIDGGISL